MSCWGDSLLTSMQPTRRFRGGAQRACTECQKRKTRCLGSNGASQACAYCVKKGKRCRFEAPPMRTSLTRKNLELAERRCEQLEAIIRSLAPDLDIEKAIEDNVATPDPQAVQDEDEYEWHENSWTAVQEAQESEENSRDGMAILTAETPNSGYLGSSSGSHLLQSVSKFLPQTTSQESSAGSQSSHGVRSHSSPHAAPNFELLNNLATSAIVDSLIHAYFRFYNHCYPIVHEGTFMKRYQSRPRGTSVGAIWQITFYMVLALGHWMTSPEAEHRKAPYFYAARQLFSTDLLESGTVKTVEACLLMGNYLQKIDRPNTGYNFIGIASRMAVGLGLHKELPHFEDDDTVDRERRRQIFWILYCFDSGFSITTGRPIMISDTFIDTRLPRNIDDSDCSLTDSVPPEVDHPTQHSASIAQAKLAIIANEIHNGLHSARTPVEVSYNFVSSMEQKLSSWRSSLPIYFNADNVPSWFLGPRSVVRWKEMNLRMLLFQASQRYPKAWPGREESRYKCMMAALESIDSISNFSKQHPDVLHPGLNWYMIYFLFQASLVLGIQALERSSSHESKATDALSLDHSSILRSGLSKAMEFLTELASISKTARRCIHVLNRILSASSTTIHDMSDMVAPNFDLSPEPIPDSLRSPRTLVSVAEGVSQDVAGLENNFGDYWAGVMDPSLNMLLEDTAPFQDFFHGVHGFPSNQERGDFDYINFSIYNNDWLREGFQG
ncbi:uncharacterized protein PV09_05733 [Verruconis gallopava]|uniref:Zn(2)-C6 fungal-type domain-containing protein n=1 Tax=Verruconis gallopava TaxID=253628 RepID=A0A0D2A8L7_9PEZI|nr:uncharacterized protein PV09_05733 [Verruconis gallopava]KIW03088.1 hypothetical protein PV09_05733 [Verruconis gallopava]